MNITVHLAPDVEEYLKEQCRLLDRPFNHVLNDAIRRGMLADYDKPKPPPYKVVPFHGKFAPDVDPLKLKDILEQEDIEHHRRVTEESLNDSAGR